MLKHSDAILKLAVALAVLLAGGGIGFYYGVFLPAQDVRRQTLELEEKRAAAEIRNREIAAQAKRLEAAQTEYQGCIAFAEESYRQRWSQSCQGAHAADEAAFEDCADDLFGSEAGCLAKRPIRPAQDCALPAAMAQTLTEARDTRKAECMTRLQAAQGSLPSATTAQ